MITFSDLLPAFQRAVGQLADGKILGILVLALIITVVLTGPFLLIAMGIAALIQWIPSPSALIWGSEAEGGWVTWSALLFWTYIMSPLAAAIIGLLLEPIVEAVESKHYRSLPKLRRRGMGEVIFYAIRFFGLMIAIGLFALIVAWLTPIPAALVWTLATGYLIAREYYETVALRRMPAAQARAATRQSLVPLWGAGCLIALCLNLPLANLIAPLIGVAAFTHLFHRAQGNSPG